MIDRVLQVCNVTKSYGSVLAVDGVSFEIGKGSFTTILGPSGCGKTTTLRVIAGFERPDRGKVVLNGLEIQDAPPYERNVNTVFQSYALFPHMTASENIAYGLENRKVPRDERAALVDDALNLIDLSDYGHRYPRQLSGGQRQRVALARAFINKPDLLLLDEPLGALDLRLRQYMQGELKRLQQELGIAFLYVTHDQEEALAMSDRVIVMNHSRIEQIDDPVTLYNRPTTAFVAEFLGGANLIAPDDIQETPSNWKIDLCGIGITLHKNGQPSPGVRPMVSIRPEKLAPFPGNAALKLRGRIEDVVFKGTCTELLIRLDGGTRVVSRAMKVDDACRVDQVVELGFDPEDVVLVSGESRGKT